MWHRLIIVFAAIALASCAGRPEIVSLPASQSATDIEPVFLATSRKRTDQGFSSERSSELSFARFDVSVPQDRQPGSVPFAENAPDSRRHFLVAGTENFSGGSDFQAALRQAQANRPPGQRELVVYVHGYNNTFAQSLYRAAQIRYDFDVPGLAVHYAWPSLESVTGYVYDRDSVLAARESFERFLQLLVQTTDERIIVLAHSMGSYLTMETLRSLSIDQDRVTLRGIGGVVLMSPDIDVQVFQAQARRIDPLPNPFIIFTSQNDRALRLSATVSRQSQRLGNIGTVDDVSDFNVTIIDLTQISDAGDQLNHSVGLSSPSLIQFVRNAPQLGEQLEDDQVAGADEVPGTVNVVRGARQIVLAPLDAVLGR
ncbi:MAG: alpha/beta hydrolase [Pseudomonadota bacterium]